MAAKPLPSPEVLRQLLRYEPDTGRLFWLPRPREMFATQRSFSAWHSNFCGKEALTATHKQGYRFGSVLCTPYLAHRIAWAIYHGEWPEDQIDHANCDKQDNRISNLRQANHFENMRNVRLKRSNRIGLKGVSHHPETGRWRARIHTNRRQLSLGLFDTPEEAHAAYCAAAKKTQGEFARVA